MTRRTTYRKIKTLLFLIVAYPFVVISRLGAEEFINGLKSEEESKQGVYGIRHNKKMMQYVGKAQSSEEVVSVLIYIWQIEKMKERINELNNIGEK